MKDSDELQKQQFPNRHVMGDTGYCERCGLRAEDMGNGQACDPELKPLRTGRFPKAHYQPQAAGDASDKKERAVFNLLWDMYNTARDSDRPGSVIGRYAFHEYIIGKNIIRKETDQAFNYARLHRALDAYIDSLAAVEGKEA